MIIRIKQKEEAQLWGVVLGTEIIASKEMERLGPAGWSAMLRQQREYRDAPEHIVQAAIRAGKLDGLKIGNRFVSKSVPMEFAIKPAFGGGQNRVVKKFFNHLFARMKGSPTAEQTLAIEYFAMGTNYGTQADPDDTQLVKEVFRFVPTQIYDNSLYSLTVSTHIQSDEGNLVNTTVSNGSTPNTSGFSVANVSGLSVGDAIGVICPDGEEECRITGINANAVAVYALNTSDNFLPSAPVVGAAVYRYFGEWGTFMGTNANSSANTGALMNRKLELYKKTVDAGVLVDNIFSFQPSGT